jgi:hypothetical protein
MAELATIAAIASVASAGVTAVGTIAAGQAARQQGDMEAAFLQQQGQAQKQAAEFEAAQLDIKAKDERALAQRERMQIQRQKKLALSSLTARAAGSGFSATDPTALALSDEIEKYGTLQEQFATYGGDVRANEMELGAAGRRFSGQRGLESAYTSASIARAGGRAREVGSYFSAGGTILGGISSFADRYGKRTTSVPKTSYRYG